MYERIFQIPHSGESFFLFGPRQTGKSTLMESLLAGRTVFKVDFLETETVLRYKTSPGLLRAEAEKFIQENPHPILFIDEVQKLPEILDSVHLLLYRYPQAQFILTGSSARKLKRGGANLLAGRALEYHLHPLTFLELGNQFVLNTQLGRGSLPSIVDLDIVRAQRILSAYSSAYLKEEIMDEALVRNIVPFNRLLEIVADQNGELVNYSNIARDVGIASKTIQAYYQILEDTLVCTRLLPYLKGARKRLIHQSRYYLFDLGIANILGKRPVTPAVPRTILYGRQFEHFIILELMRLAHYFEKTFSFFHWRDTTGNEVDLIIEAPGKLWACEIKAKDNVLLQDLKGLQKFATDYPHAELICLSLSPRPYTLKAHGSAIEVWPWQEFIHQEFTSRVLTNPQNE